MQWELTPYVAPLLFTGAVLTLFAGFLGRWSRREGSRGLSLAALLMGASAVWVFGHAGSHLSVTLESAVVWVAVEHLGVLSLSIVWLAYVLWYTGRDDLLTRRVFGPLVLMAATVLGLFLTNSFHGLFWVAAWMQDYGSFTVFKTTHGPAFWLFVGFVYTTLLLALALLFGALLSTRGVFQRQIAALLLFGLLPGVAGVAYITGHNPLPGLNIAAVSTVVTVIAGAVSVVRSRRLDLVPVARDQTFDAVGDPVLVVSDGGTVLDCNERARELFGVDDPVGMPLSDASSRLAGRMDTAGELTLETRLGERSFDLVIADVGDSPNKEGVRTLVLHDITDRLRAERELADREAAMARLLEFSERLGGAREADTVYRLAVEAATSLFDADRARLVLEREGQLVPAATTTDRPLDALPTVSLRASLSGSALDAGEPVSIDDLSDTRRAAAGGGFVDWDDRWNPMSAADAASESGADERPGTATESPVPEDTAAAEAAAPVRSALLVPVGDVGVFQVLSTDSARFDDRDRELAELLASHVGTALARVEAEADVRRERDRLSTFADTVAHDLRNPLSVAQGYTDMVRRDTGEERLDTVADSLERMEALIDDLLTLARHGQVVDDPEPVSLDSTVRDAWDSVRTPSGTLDLPAEALGTVCADRARLHELLGNLFRNAVEHGSMHDSGDAENEPSTLTVRVERTPDGFAVADDGQGVPPEDRESVFDSGFTTSEDGTGLGLAIVERIAAAHDWSVRLEASAEGGARFVIGDVTFLDENDGSDVDGSDVDGSNED